MVIIVIMVEMVIMVAEIASKYMKKVKNMRRFRLKKWIRKGNMVFVIVRTPAPAALWKDKSRRMFHLARERQIQNPSAFPHPYSGRT